MNVVLLAEKYGAGCIPRDVDDQINIWKRRSIIIGYRENGEREESIVCI